MTSEAFRSDPNPRVMREYRSRVCDCGLVLVSGVGGTVIFIKAGPTCETLDDVLLGGGVEFSTWGTEDVRRVLSAPKAAARGPSESCLAELWNCS